MWKDLFQSKKNEIDSDLLPVYRIFDVLEKESWFFYCFQLVFRTKMSKIKFNPNKYQIHA